MPGNNYREQMVALGRDARKQYFEKLAKPEERLQRLFEIVQNYVQSVKTKERIPLVTPFSSDSELRFQGVIRRLAESRDSISLGIEKRYFLDGAAHNHEEMVLIGVEGTVRVKKHHLEDINQQFIIEPHDGDLFLYRSTSYGDEWGSGMHVDARKYIAFIEQLVHKAIPRHGGPDTG